MTMMLGRVPIRGLHRMGSGAMSQATLPESQLSRVRQYASAAIRELAVQVEYVKMEAQLLSPEARAADGEAPWSIDGVAGFQLSEIVSLLDRDVEKLLALIARLRSGSVGPYLTQDQVNELIEIKSAAQAVSTGLPQVATKMVAQEHSRAADAHFDIHAKDVLKSIQDAEKAVVAGEAGPGGAVPVLEPYEKDEARVMMVAGGVALGLVVLVAVFS